MVHDEAFTPLDYVSRLDPVQSTVLAAAIKCKIAADHRSDRNCATTICDQAIRLAKDRENNGEVVANRWSATTLFRLGETRRFN